MNHRLYVGNLSYTVTTESLQARFAEFGDVVETHVVTDRETKRPRGFAFVTMTTASAATYAIEQLNDTMFEGRALRVNVAQERSASASSQGARNGHGW